MTVRGMEIPRVNRPSAYTLSAAFTVFVLVTEAALLAWRPLSSSTLLWISDAADVLGPSTLLVVWAAQVYPLVRRAERGRSRLFWTQFLIALAVASDVVAQFGWSFNAQILHVSPFPSWTDGFYLGFYVFVFAGIFLLPSRRGSALARAKLLVDGLAAAVAIGILSWYFIIGPTVFDETSSTFSTIVASLYPVFDLVLLFCLVVLWVRADDPRLRRSIGLLTTAIVVVVVADSIFQYQDLMGTYQEGTVLDVLWVAADMLVAMAALALASDLRWNRLSRDSSSDARQVELSDAMPTWLEYLPYLALPVVYGFFLSLWNTPGDGDDYLEPGVLLGCVIFTIVLFVRQMLAIRENQNLHQEIREDALSLAAINLQVTASNRDLALANERLESLATSDPLTNLLNHRAINGILDQEIERAYRYRRYFSLLFIDLDHFKTINDTYGHGAGDLVLTDFATVMREQLRGVDLVGRWGGEEFLVILPEVDGIGAVECAERVRSNVASHQYSVGGGIHLTCSIGVASYPDNAVERGQLVDLADQAMYAAKRLGRNQVRQSGEEAVSALARSGEDGDLRADTTLVGVVEALAALVEARDRYTGRHMAAVGRLVTRLALELGLDSSEAQMLGMAGLLHDIGKVGVPDAILQKPAHLANTEWAALRMHTIVGADVVSRVPALRPIAPIIRGHHERWDGSGYPDGLAGEAIPYGSRIVSVVDAYGAITSNRPYRIGRSREWAFDELRRCAGHQFDPAIVDAFLTLLETEDLSTTETGHSFFSAVHLTR